MVVEARRGVIVKAVDKGSGVGKTVELERKVIDEFAVVSQLTNLVYKHCPWYKLNSSKL